MNQFIIIIMPWLDSGAYFYGKGREGKICTKGMRREGEEEHEKEKGREGRKGGSRRPTSKGLGWTGEVKRK